MVATFTPLEGLTDVALMFIPDYVVAKDTK
jgi:hypothetical protein